VGGRLLGGRIGGRGRRRAPSIAFGEREEQVLERHRLGRERADQRACLHERLRQLGGGRLVSGEDDPSVLVDVRVGDPRLGTADGQRALVVGRLQAVGGAGATLERRD